ncbi:MAG: tetraacyldisaccharide 4'-kinase [Pseudomonadota bacterium]
MKTVVERYLNEVWYGKRPGMWLRPLGALYGAAMRARRAAYRRGWRAVYRPPIPVIVVGNRTVGGTGKTPMVIELVARLSACGAVPGVISRGYGGAVTGAEAKRVEAASRSAVVGDEPVLVARRTGALVAVSPTRRLACELVMDAGANVIVADDGLQHLALARDVAINVIDGTRGLGNARCLPAGPMREPRDLAADDALDMINGQDFELVPDGIRTLQTGQTEPLDAWQGRRVHAVAGIGHPDRFFKVLSDAGLNVVAHPRGDHAPLSLDDLDFGDDDPVVMTEKDAVKLTSVNERVHDVPVTAVPTPEAAARLDGAIAMLLEATA